MEISKTDMENMKGRSDIIYAASSFVCKKRLEIYMKPSHLSMIYPSFII